LCIAPFLIPTQSLVTTNRARRRNHSSCKSLAAPLEGAIDYFATAMPWRNWSFS